jgi:hypothetical protein
MKRKQTIDYTDKSLYEDNGYMQCAEEQDFYTPEEAYESVMNDVMATFLSQSAIL